MTSVERLLDHEQDQIAAAALLIASVTMLFTVWYQGLLDTANVDVLPQGQNADNLERMREALWRIRLLIVLTVLLLLTFAPSAAATCVSLAYPFTERNWAYDAVRTSFIFVIVFAGTLLSNLWTIKRKLREKKTELDAHM